MCDVRVVFKNCLSSLFPVGMAACLPVFGFFHYESTAAPKTFCNPLNISYNFQTGYREAADPVIVLYKNDYFLFVSHSAGYWYSDDLLNWQFVPIDESVLPINAYAPGAFVVNDILYFIASSSGMYSSIDPKKGAWNKVTSWTTETDPALFLDDDGKAYLYWGCSNSNPTYGIQLDRKSSFAKIGSIFNGAAFADTREHGWERPGNNHELTQSPWVEGSWMSKYGSTYYLQYSAPGTEFDTYADGVYTSSSPSGPFTYQPYSPVAYKPRGFINGAGHGCLFQDKHGNYWRVATMAISVLHNFERRIALFPAGFDAEGVLFTNTVLGDYPIIMPSGKIDPVSGSSPGWMLLSYRKKMTSSTTLLPHTADKACNENVKDYWSALTRNPGEWLQMDLGVPCTLFSIQTNFAEHESNIKGRPKNLYQQYTIAISTNGSSWSTIIDKSANTSDVPHDYIELPGASIARYIKLTNVYTPGAGTFSVRGLRVFGKAPGFSPARPTGLIVQRDKSDSCVAKVSWHTVPDAEGYILRYGIQPDKLYLHYLIYDSVSLTIRALNRSVPYFFTIESFNRCGRSSDPLFAAHPVTALPARGKKSAELLLTGFGNRNAQRVTAGDENFRLFRINGKSVYLNDESEGRNLHPMGGLPAGAYLYKKK